MISITFCPYSTNVPGFVIYMLVIDIQDEFPNLISEERL